MNYNLDIIEISDISVPELDIYARLREPQLLHLFEPDAGIFIAESPKVIKLALSAGYEPISFLIEKKYMDKELFELGIDFSTDESSKRLCVYTAETPVLQQITGFKLTRGMLCAMRRKALPAPEEICRNATRIAVLENVVNPANMGAIIRSAAGLGFEAVLLTPGCVDPLYRRALRVSMGTTFQIPWTYLPEISVRYESISGNSAQNESVSGDSAQNESVSGDSASNDSVSSGSVSYVKYLRKLGFCTAAMALTRNAVSIDSQSPADEERLAVILGNEGNGLSESTISESDYTIMIPMLSNVDSLNVAAASAVAFWQLGNRKKI